MQAREDGVLRTPLSIFPGKTTLLVSMMIAMFALGIAELSHGAERSPQTTRIAIIIDDIGYNLTRGKRALALNNVTLAIIPEAPYAENLAQRALAAQREVIIHLPMGAGEGVALDEGGIHAGMSEREITDTLDTAFQRIPAAVGLNNHMGSHLTTETEVMGWVMQSLQDNQLFFIDSRTTPLTVAEQVAEHLGVPVLGRDVFLDNELHVLDINERFNQLLSIARQRGYALAIGHPHDSTLDYLEAVLPLLAEMSIELVPVSVLVEQQAHLKMAARRMKADKE